MINLNDVTQVLRSLQMLLCYYEPICYTSVGVAFVINIISLMHMLHNYKMHALKMYRYVNKKDLFKFQKALAVAIARKSTASCNDYDKCIGAVLARNALHTVCASLLIR